MLFLFACSPSQATIPSRNTISIAALSYIAASCSDHIVIHCDFNSTYIVTNFSSAHTIRSATRYPGTSFFSSPQNLGHRFQGGAASSFLYPSDRGDRSGTNEEWYRSVPVDDQSGTRRGRTSGSHPRALPNYPIFSKIRWALCPHLVSYGFVVVGIKNLDTYEPWDRFQSTNPLTFCLPCIRLRPVLLMVLKI